MSPTRAVHNTALLYRHRRQKGRCVYSALGQGFHTSGSCKPCQHALNIAGSISDSCVGRLCSLCNAATYEMSDDATNCYLSGSTKYLSSRLLPPVIDIFSRRRDRDESPASIFSTLQTRDIFLSAQPVGPFDTRHCRALVTGIAVTSHLCKGIIFCAAFSIAYLGSLSLLFGQMLV